MVAVIFDSYMFLLNRIIYLLTNMLIVRKQGRLSALHYNLFVFALITFFICAGQAQALDLIHSGNSFEEMVKQVGSGKPIVPQWRPQPAASTSNKKPFSTAPSKKVSNLPTQSATRLIGPIQSKTAVVRSFPSPSERALSHNTHFNEQGTLPATSGREPSRITALATAHSTPASQRLAPQAQFNSYGPRVKAKAMMCVDCASNKVMLANNASEPLPIASITKLLTAMVVIDEMDLDRVLEVPADIDEVEPHKIGIRPGDMFTVRDLLHGMLIASGNDCAETLARAYPKGGRVGFMSRMNSRAAELGAHRVNLYTPSGLDVKMALGRKEGRTLETRKPNVASAEDVATIARHAFSYPLIREIAAMKTYTMRTHNTVARDYRIASNDKLLSKNLPIAGAKTGFTNRAGRCIVALFKDQRKEHVIVVLNSPQHFKAAEKIYRWACKAL